ncbi:GtrA family protein [Paenibacillus filicis]|uniref:GtrA family protein n=1 Tax=Paenibacillus filicis TaxID=669464 RepID=A0ABU9DCC5_9BACL
MKPTTFFTSSVFRFLLVGLLNTAIGLSVMLGLLHLAGLDYWTSTLLGTAVGACVSYLLNRTFTFKSQASYKSSLVKFILVLACCYLVAYASSSLFTNVLREFVPILSEDMSHTVAVVLGNGLYTVLNYVGQRYVVFGSGSKKTSHLET